MKIEVSQDTYIETSTQEDIDYVETNFRDGDRLEHESLDGGRTLLSMFEDTWTVKHKGKIIGYCGVAVPWDETAHSQVRFLCYMSCKNADKHKIAYVRDSRAVMKAIIETTPPWVEEYKSLPNLAYVGSVIWHERVLKMKRIREIEYRKQKFILFSTSREEALK